jgi:PAS domain S-box-containing protein
VAAPAAATGIGAPPVRLPQTGSLANADRHFRTVVTRAPVGIFETDALGNCLFANEYWLGMAGLSLERALGRGWLRALHPRDSLAILAACSDPYPAGEEPVLEYRMQAPDGRVTWVSGRIIALRDEMGAILGFFGAATDITDRKRLETALRDSAARTSAILGATADGIITLTEQGVVESFNPAAEGIFGYEADEVIGDPVTRLIPALDGPALASMLDAAQTSDPPLGAAARREMAGRRRNGEAFPLELGACAVKIGARRLLTGTVRDLTLAKRAEAALAVARDQALEAARLKSEFVATMSHEIRTPFSGVLGMLEILLDTPLDQDQRELATVARESAQALLDIVNGILDLSKIEAGKLMLDAVEFSPADVVERAAEALATKAHAKRLAFATYIAPDVPRRLIGDPGRLRQIVLNLISNAVKFTESGEVIIRVAPVGEVGGRDMLRVAVTDTGIGIDEAVQARLFTPFTQADGSTTRRYGGTGLGLAICKRLVEHMGGAIGVASAPGRGSTFWFTVCFDRAPGSDARATAEIDLSSRRALVVDRAAASREALTAYLEAWGAHVDAAPTGRAALRAVLTADHAGRPYDAVIVDLATPATGGAAFVGALRRRTDQPAPPLILLTTIEGAAAERADAGGDPILLVKPVKQRQLAAALGRMLTGGVASTIEPSDRPRAPSGRRPPDRADAPEASTD